MKSRTIRETLASTPKGDNYKVITETTIWSSDVFRSQVIPISTRDSKSPGLSWSPVERVYVSSDDAKAGHTFLVDQIKTGEIESMMNIKEVPRG